MKYVALSLDLLGLMLTVIGFWFLLRPPFPLIFDVDPRNGEDRVRPNKLFKEDYFTWKLGIKINLVGLFFQGFSIWLQIAFT